VPPVQWTPSSSLFVVFMGICDVAATSYRWKDEQYDPIFEAYRTLVKKLYAEGGRNFMFMNVPPFQRAPGASTSSVKANNHVVGIYNDFVYNTSRWLGKRHDDVKTFYFDTNEVFTKALDYPRAYAQTAEITNIDGLCDG
jgi:phospholipase/lecithinase/hemolysin